MKLIIGLGNPGREYQNTRHNIGFMCIDYLVKYLNITSKQTKFGADIWKYHHLNEQYLLVKPLSFMNLSGKPIASITAYFQISAEDLLVIYDEKDLNFAKIKIAKSTSPNGHNGIKNIIKLLQYNNFNRLKIGVGNNNNYKTEDWVLSKFNKEEIAGLAPVYRGVQIIIEEWFKGYDFSKISSLNNFNKVKEI